MERPIEFKLSSEAQRSLRNLTRAVSHLADVQAREYRRVTLLMQNGASFEPGEYRDVVGAFIDPTNNVIGYEGESYYRTCSKFVAELPEPDGRQTFCFKRVGHPNSCEDYDGRTRD